MSESSTPAESGAVELLRVWLAEESLQCALQANVFDDAGSWGEVLADVVRHIADALQQQDGTPAEQTRQRIRQAFDNEIGSESEPRP
jgi:hypothetical protein